MDKEKLVNFSFEEYLKSGGRLDEKSFMEAEKLVNNAKNSEKFVKYGPCFGQVCSMAKRHNLEVKDEQINAYIFLRETELTGRDGGLCDQEILAETLLLTGDIVTREQFVNQNLHIFKN